MKEEKNGPDFLLKVSAWIVDRRNLIFLVYGAAVIFAFFSRNWVSVNNDITDYLSEETETKQGLTVMEEQFTTFGTARVMVSNITYEKACDLAEVIKETDGVSAVDMGSADSAQDREAHYRECAVLYDITFEWKETDEACADALEAVKEALGDYDVSVSASVGNEDIKNMQDEMSVVMGITAVIILLVLLFTSKSYGEIPVLVLTFVTAMVLDMGINFIYGEISFISNSIYYVLQLALSIDYAIILCHRFGSEREKADAREACIVALSKAIPEISSSCMTTLSGLLALMFMEFKIGFDMGRVLITAVILSIITVFTLMPGLLMLFSGLIDRTRHRSFVPKVSFLGKMAVKLRFAVPPLFVCVLAVSGWYSAKCPYAYGYSLIQTSNESSASMQERAVTGRFGTQNTLAVLVPAGDYEKEGRLLRELSQLEEIDSAMGLANVELGIDGYVLTDRLTPRQFAEMTDMDIETIRLLYAAYAAEHEEYGRIIGDTDNYSISILELFLFAYDRMEEGFVQLEDEMRGEMEDMHGQITDAMAQLQGETYSRLVISLNLPEEGSETFAFLERLHTLTERYYDRGSFYIVGNSTSDFDLAASFETDNVLISILTIVFVIIVLLFTFKSVGMPVLLILVIQGSIWMNFGAQAISGDYIFFLSYLIVSSIQMGANIDYAIVIASRYQELKQEMHPKEAIVETLNQAFPTVLTSGSIMAGVGIAISGMTSDGAIYGVGVSIGRGTLISIFLVLIVLPTILLLGDSVIERTSFDIRYPELWQTSEAEGRVHLDGWVRGEISGKLNAEVHGVLEGSVNGIVRIGQDSREESGMVFAEEESREKSGMVHIGEKGREAGGMVHIGEADSTACITEENGNGKET